MKILLILLTLCVHFAALTAPAKPLPKVLALSPHIVEMLYDIGAGEQIIGTTDFADYPKAAQKIPRIGNYARIQIERVVELQPDLIFAWKSGNPSDDLERLAKLGFTIVYSQPNSSDDIANEMAYFGELTGHKKQAIKVVNRFKAQLARIQQKYQTKPLINTFYELWSRPLSTIAKGSWPQQHLDICRAKNLFVQAKSQYPQVNIEQVLIKDIDVIIQPLSEKQTEREAFNWHSWPLITAVKHQQIIQPNADALHRMTLRSLIALEDLCEKIDTSRKFYQSLANLNPS